MTETSLRTLIEKWRKPLTGRFSHEPAFQAMHDAELQCADELEALLQSSSCGVGTLE